jgi:hypothetical protein
MKYTEEEQEEIQKEDFQLRNESSELYNENEDKQLKNDEMITIILWFFLIFILVL